MNNNCNYLIIFLIIVTHPEDTEFLKFRINDLNSKMKESLVNALALVDKYESYVSYSDTTSVVYLPFLNVLQLIFESEVNLSSSKTCSDDCEQFKSQQYSRNGCYGNIHDCMFKVPVNTSVEQSISVCLSSYESNLYLNSQLNDFRMIPTEYTKDTFMMVNGMESMVVPKSYHRHRW